MFKEPIEILPNVCYTACATLKVREALGLADRVPPVGLAEAEWESQVLTCPVGRPGAPQDAMCCWPASQSSPEAPGRDWLSEATLCSSERR